jgi:hypothetical protein
MLEMLQVPDQACLSCGKAYCGSDDLITLNGTDEVVEKLREALRRRRAEDKLKKSAKRKRLEGPKTSADGGNAHTHADKKVLLLEDCDRRVA